MRTYAELLQSLDSRPEDTCQRFVGKTETVVRSAGETLAAACARGRQLLARGVTKGQRVGIAVSQPADFLPVVQGCLLYGLVAVPLYPPPLFGRLESYKLQLNSILDVARARVMVLDDALKTRLGEVPIETVTLSALSESDPNDAAEPTLKSPDPDDLALLQFTSGSTASPKGVSISHAALMANVHAIMIDGLAASASDHGVTWLPLYHDMGLIGFGLAPLLTQTPVTFIPTASFVRNPAVWLQTLAAVRGTITFAPNFAYALVTRRVTATGLDLSSVRMWGCGAEPVFPSTLDAFEQHFAGSGVKPGQVSPCYGLAEATLAVTFTTATAGRVVHQLDAQTWHTQGLAVDASSRGEGEPSPVRFVACGTPLPGYSVAIVDAQGHALAERHAGEIVVRGPSLGAGYFGAAQPSAQVFQRDGVHTGDRGYLADGQLFVTGRIKDTLIVNGKNYDPHVIEQIAEAIVGVRRAAAVNYAGSGVEELALLLECATPDQANLQQAVRAAIASTLGLSAARVICLAPGRLPRTTSGKLRRSAARALVGDDLEKKT